MTTQKQFLLPKLGAVIPLKALLKITGSDSSNSEQSKEEEDLPKWKKYGLQNIPDDWYSADPYINPKTHRVNHTYRCTINGCNRTFEKTWNLNAHFKTHRNQNMD